LIKVLEETKSKSVKIAQAIEDGKVTGKLIEENRQVFIPAALRGSILFFVMTGLTAVSKMYEYSLTSYLEVFK
jgi:dynein heavy chain